MLKRTWNLQRVDLELVILKLRELYLSKSQEEAVFPIVKVGRTIVKGPLIRETYLRYLESIPNRRKFLALDSSLKVLFDLGFCKLIVAKVSVGIWYRGRRVYWPEPRIRVNVVKSKREAGEWLLGIELEEVTRHLNKLGIRDYCLLDRGLITYPSTSRTLKLVAKRLVEKSIKRGITLIGIPKRCSIKLSNGLNALSFIARMANRKFPDMPWYYHPLLRGTPELLFESSAVARFSEDSNAVFRVDLVGEEIDVAVALGEVSYLQDSSLPGYPYPLKAVHDEARISEFELEHLRGVVLDILGEEDLLDYILGDLNTTSFKERYLWGW